MCSTVGLAYFGCALPPPTAPVQASSPPLEPLHVHPLSDLVVAAGMEWMLFLQPQKFSKHPALAPGFMRLAPVKRRLVFQRLTGIDLDSIHDAIIAGYDDSTLFVLEGLPDLPETEELFRDRLIFDVERKVYRPDAIWVHGRTASQKDRAIGILAPHVVVVEAGRWLRSKVAMLFALGRLKRSPRALDLPDMQLALDALDDSPLRILIPGPFEGQWANAARGLLTSCSTIGLGGKVDSEGRLNLALRLLGAWGEDAPHAAKLLIPAWKDLAQSSLGRLLDLENTLEPPTIRAKPDMLCLDVAWDGGKLMDGLHHVIRADIWEILQGDASTKTP